MALFVKHPVDWWDQPQIVQAGERAAVLLLRMQCWAKLHLTDGLVPAAIVAHFGLTGTTARLRALVDAGLIEQGPLGWLIVGWLDENMSRAEVEAVGEKRREAGKRGAQAKQIAKQLASNLPSKPEANQYPELQSYRATENPPAPELDQRPEAPDPPVVLLADQLIEALGIVNEPANQGERNYVARALARGWHDQTILDEAIMLGARADIRDHRAYLGAVLKRYANEDPPATAPPEPRPLLHDQHPPCPNPECVDGWVGGIGPDGRPETPERCPDCTGVRA